MQDEESLVRRAQQHDETALTQIYEENFDRIYRYVFLKIGDRAEAEDITQQVFINALKSIASYRYRKGVPLSAWLYRIAHNLIVDNVRKRSRRATVPLEESIAASDSNPSLAAERKMSIEELSSAIKCLTKAQQEVITLRFTSEMAIARVARIMGKSEGAIKALQHSAVVALRKAMAQG